MANNRPLLDRDESQWQSECGQARAARKNAKPIALLQDAFMKHLRDIHPKPGSLDTLRASGFVLPELTSPNAIGSAIGSLSRRGYVVCVGVVRGRRPRARCAKIYLWKLAEGVAHAK